VFENRVLRIFGERRGGGEIYMIMSCIIYRPAVHAVQEG
jgi:hypothetical protein